MPWQAINIQINFQANLNLSGLSVAVKNIFGHEKPRRSGVSRLFNQFRLTVIDIHRNLETKTHVIVVWLSPHGSHLLTYF